MMWPFSWHALTPDGTNEFVSQPFALDTVFTTLLDTARATSLVSLGVLPIGQGYIQVLSDSRSDLRVMVIYRKDGTKVRALPIATAMGLIATSADSEEVLAIRKTDILEAVRYAYKWNWVAPGDLHRR
jgi:hypothetical protein